MRDYKNAPGIRELDEARIEALLACRVATGTCLILMLVMLTSGFSL